MFKNNLLLYVFFLLSISCASQKIKKEDIAIATTPVIAFPEAEGFGKFATGGRGGSVRIVTNLDDDGEGSFRKAVIANEPRIIVFAVSGTIHLKSKLNIKGNVTIAGQTAPGDGICIADHPVTISGDNVIVRYLRFRMGDRFQNKGMVDGSGNDDAFSSKDHKNIIIDHCSFSWSSDEVLSVYGVDSTTLQWNIISEPLNYSYHFEEGDTDFQKHGYGGIWGGKHLSAHHNLIAHCNSRTPRLNGLRLGTKEELVDFRNNVIYNWGNNNIYGGEGGNYNMVNNYYSYGPETKKSIRFRIVNPNKEEKLNIPYGKFYVNGNYVSGSEEVTTDNYKGIDIGNNGTETDKKNAVVSKDFFVVSIKNQSALNAYKDVLNHAGASLPLRDTLDQRIIENVKSGTGNFIDVQGGFPHGTAYEKTVKAWPTLTSKSAQLDSDKDGMPDEWELKNKLNPKDKSDAAQFSLSKSYTNIEMYINSLIEK